MSMACDTGYITPDLTSRLGEAAKARWSRPAQMARRSATLQRRGRGAPGAGGKGRRWEREAERDHDAMKRSTEINSFVVVWGHGLLKRSAAAI